METWEKEYIRSSLVSLIDEIDSNAVLPYLLQSNIISRPEKEELNLIGRQTGLIAEAEKLLDIIRGRVHGYQHLVKALYIAKQTGPMITLLYGVQFNTLANPFRYCKTELRLDEILSKKVNFGGYQITLADICKDLNEHQIIALREIIDVSIYKSLIGGDEVIVAKDTIPPVIPYYIKRKLTLPNKLSTKIFMDRQQDYFLIENVEPFQLTNLAQTNQTEETAGPSNRFLRLRRQHSIATSVSSDQLHTLSARFILLENEQHFDQISSRSKEESIHLLKFADNDYFLVRSSNPENVKRYILDEEVSMSEEEFLRSTKYSYPVIIFDTPGMGKSSVLTKLAYQLKQQMPTEYVIYFQMQDLVNRLLLKNCTIDIALIESELLGTISTNKFGTFINRELFNKPCQIFYLFLDAFDEVISDHQDLAAKVVKILNDNKFSFKIYITSRPHQGAILEKICRVIGYGIRPFQLQEQIDFLVEYWQNQCSVESAEELVQYAKNLLSEFRDKISSKDREITGIPLQCKMLADVYAKDAQSKLYSKKNSKIKMNTIYDMYREYFCQKFPNTVLQPGRSQLLDFHFKIALDLLFPGFSTSLNFWQVCKKHEELFSTGLIELSKSGNNQFVHRTFAEFLVAEFVGSLVNNRQTVPEFPMEIVLELCFSKVLEVVEFDFLLPFCPKDNVCMYKTFKFRASRFKFPILAFFLDHCFIFYTQENEMPFCNELLRRCKDLLCPKKSKELLLASLENNSMELYKLATSLPRKLFTHDLNKCVHSNSNVTFVEWSLILASQIANVDLLTLHYAFMSNLVKKPLTQLIYEVEDHGSIFESHPILFSSQQGDYHTFEFVFNNMIPDKTQHYQLIYFCLNNSYTNSTISITGKLQILKFLFSNHSTIKVDIKQVSLFSFQNAHVELLLFLFAQGACLLKKDWFGCTIVHRVAIYLSAEEYHKIVEWVVEHEFSSIFQLKDENNETAVHYALKKLELQSKTLQILAHQCNINFNEKNKDGETEFVLAIQRGRSVAFLTALVQFGADINTLDKQWCGVLCHSIKSRNVETLKYFLSLGINPNKRCAYFLGNIWEHVLGSANESFDISEIAMLLIQNGTDVNKLLLDDDGHELLPDFKPASEFLEISNLNSECVDILNEQPIVRNNATIYMSNLCFWTCICCTCCCCQLCSVYEDNE